ncbi:MAG: hypothetical protein ACI9FU_000130 [Granulosicoccus sp.]|jgi:hypothetical protein
MRAAVLTISLICALAFGANAQSLYGFNVGGILNVTNSVDSARSMIRMGAVVEGFYMYQFSPMFYGKTGVGYSQRGYQANFQEIVVPDTANPIHGEVVRSAWLHYVDVPLMLGITSRNAYFEVGGLFSFSVANQAQEQGFAPDRKDGIMIYDSIPSLGLNTFHASLAFNIGYRFVLKDNMSLGLALRTSMLQNLSTNLKAQYFGLSLGLTFGTPLEGTNDAYDFKEEEDAPTPDGD